MDDGHMGGVVVPPCFSLHSPQISLQKSKTSSKTRHKFKNQTRCSEKKPRLALGGAFTATQNRTSLQLGAGPPQPVPSKPDSARRPYFAF